MRAKILGVAGYMGSGKTTAARFFAGNDGVILDADMAAKQIMNRSAALQKKIVAAFGPRMVQDGLVQSGELGRAVFADLSALKKLNAIVHPALVAHLDKSVRAVVGGLCVVDAALLPLWRLQARFDLLLWVSAGEELRFARLRKKLPLSDAQIRARMRMQEKLFAPPRGTGWRMVENERSIPDLFAVCDTLRRALTTG